MPLYIIILNIKHLTLKINVKSNSSETCSPHHLPLRRVCPWIHVCLERDSQHGFRHIMRLAETSKSTGLGKWMGAGKWPGNLGGPGVSMDSTYRRKITEWMKRMEAPLWESESQAERIGSFLLYHVLMLWNPNCLLIKLLWPCFRRENLAIIPHLNCHSK